MTTIQSHRDLVAWQRAVELSLLIYKLTSKLPESERFGLCSQLRRGAVSVASNIAEGYGRGSTADYLRFLRMARGSLFEADTQLLIATRLGYLSEGEYNDAYQNCKDCGKILAGLIRSIEASQ